MRRIVIFSAVVFALLVPSLSAAKEARRGYVYAGICGPVGWYKAHFDGLPFCDGEVVVVGETKATRRGMKVRSYWPKWQPKGSEGFGKEIGRLKKGESVRLVVLRASAGKTPLPGPKVWWAEIEF